MKLENNSKCFGEVENTLLLVHVAYLNEINDLCFLGSFQVLLHDISKKKRIRLDKLVPV